VIPIGDGLVTQIRVDYAFGLSIDSWIHVRIESAFTVERGGQVQSFDPAETQTLAPLLRLHQAKVTEALARKDGVLTLTFDDGSTLTVPPDDQYEAFTVNGELPPVRRRFMLAALPGGGLTRM
jgi:hypothetical protein